MNFDPDQPDMHFACQGLPTRPSAVCVSLMPVEPCWRRSVMGNDQVTRRARRCATGVARGTKIVPGRDSRGFDAPLARLIRMIPRTRTRGCEDTDIVILGDDCRRELTRPTPSVTATPVPSTPATPAKRTPARLARW